MASSINASTTAGVVTTADTSGVLNIQTAGVTAISIDASQAVTFTNSANLPNTFGFKNRIINGAMVIDQRNAGASITPTTDTYCLDRWLAGASVASKYSVQQNAGSVTPPSGFSKYLGVTSLSAYSVAAGDNLSLAQFVEGFNFADLGWGTANAKTVTLSFQVYSSLTGTFGGALVNSAVNRSYPFSYSIAVANTWTTISITVAGDTSGTWIGATNGVGVRLYFGLGVGSTYQGTAGAWAGTLYLNATGATSVVGTNGATFYITGVQLEKGATATSFDYRDYGRELIMCQRYYAKQLSIATFTNFGIGTGISATNASMWLKFNVTMRSAPTISVASMGLSDGSNLYVITSLSTGYIGTDSALLQPVASSGLLVVFRPYQLQANNSTSAFVDYSSEL